MADKLTLQDWMLYNNSKLLYKNEKHKIFSANYFNEFVELIHNNYWDMDILDKNSFTDLIPISNCKLILRDISQLTDEERKHIDRLACINPITVRSNLKKSVLLIRYVIYESKELDYAIMKDDLQICDYLRSINIDIDDYLLSGKAVKG